MSDPQVTIVIPCHNHARWVGGAMRSVAEQDYPNKRLVVIDDGSTDDSWTVIDSFADRIRKTGVGVCTHRIRKAVGPSAARNVGIRLSWTPTDIYGFLDSDDYYLPGKISKSVAKILEDPVAIGGVSADYETFNEESGIKIREFKEPYSRERLLRECLLTSPLLTKTTLEKVGLFDEELRVAEDYDLWLRISEKFIFLHIPEALLRIRVGNHNSTSTVKKEVWQDCWKKVVEKTRQRCQPS